MDESSFQFYVTSDLHFGGTRKGDRCTRALAAHVCEHPCDGLFLVGDLAQNAEKLDELLELFANFPGHKVALPGNHDIWYKGWPSEDSWEIHETLLPAQLKLHGFHPLHMEPLNLGPVAFVGSMGWYDYSFRDDIGIGIEHYRSKTPPWAEGPIWNDVYHVRLPEPDEAFTQTLVVRLQDQLAALSTTGDVVAMVHHVVDKSLLVHPRERVPEFWRYANAFLGSNLFGDVLKADPRVKQAFCGHIHLERYAQVGHCDCACIGSDHTKKQLFRANASSILEKQTFTS